MAIDLLPTFARLAGAELPAQRIDGLDLWPLFAGEPGARNPHSAYFHYYGRNELQAVRSGRWKLFFPHESRTVASPPPVADGRPGKYRALPVATALYDLQADLGETTDVAAEHPEIVERLTALAEQARGDLGDSLAGRTGSGAREPGRWTPEE